MKGGDVHKDCKWQMGSLGPPRCQSVLAADDYSLGQSLILQMKGMFKRAETPMKGRVEEWITP
jgi:hypothetical protein